MIISFYFHSSRGITFQEDPTETSSAPVDVEETKVISPIVSQPNVVAAPVAPSSKPVARPPPRPPNSTAPTRPQPRPPGTGTPLASPMSSYSPVAQSFISAQVVEVQPKSEQTTAQSEEIQPSATDPPPPPPPPPRPSPPGSPAPVI